MNSDWKYLVIVESPVKKRTISRFLGSKFCVVATGGHFRGLFNRTPYQEPPGKETLDVSGFRKDDQKTIKFQIQEFLKQNKPASNPEPLKPETNAPRYLAVTTTENGYRPWYYITNPGFVQYVNGLLKEKPDATIFLATDPDREGEGIAWHIVDVLAPHHPNVTFKRMIFHAVNKYDIQRAIKNASDHLSSGLIEAYKSREILDQIIGFCASRALWYMNRGKNRKTSLSLGRVQVAGLELLMREEERALQTIPAIGYRLKIRGKTKSKKQFIFETIMKDPAYTLDTLKTRVPKQKAEVLSFEKDKELKHARPAYSLAAYQQDMYRFNRVGAKQALSVAQYLFESGAISYPRTDSIRMTGGTFKKFVEVAESLGAKTSASPPNYKSKRKNAQEAHEALVPKSHKLFDLMKEYLTKSSKDSFAKWAAGKVKGFNANALEAYELIFRRTLCAVIRPVGISCRKAIFSHPEIGERIEVETTTVKVPGWSEFWKYEIFDSETKLPELGGGEIVSFSIVSGEPWTEDIIRPGAQSLVRSLDQLGIGRPSSTASMIDTLERRGYVNRGMSLFGALVTSMARECYRDSLDVDTTAAMDEKLNDLALIETQTDRAGAQLLDHFIGPFCEKLDKARDFAKAFEEILRNMGESYSGISRDKLTIVSNTNVKANKGLAGVLHPVSSEWNHYGSLVYRVESLSNKSGFLCLSWKEGKVIWCRYYYLYSTPLGEEMTGVLTLRTDSGPEGEKDLVEMMKYVEPYLDGKPLGFIAAWKLFSKLLTKRSRHAEFDLHGFFPTLKREKGSGSIHQWVFGGSG